MLFPFIWHQKLDTIARKYMFVIEKYGYLTDLEEDNLKKELSSQGFNIEKTNIIVPKNPKSYGELIEFSIEYRYDMNSIAKIFELNNREVNIKVRKTSFCKK